MADDYYIGLMSGTSLDGIDAVLVKFSDDSPLVVDALYTPLSPAIKDEIKSLINPADNELNRLMSLDIQLGKLFAQSVKELLDKSGFTHNQVKAIGSHGQTIRHFPTAEYANTLQIGDANTIAELTGITTVADFRRRDMAAGGQGAPLVPAFHEKLFRSKDINRIILNLGGIANITLLLKDQAIPVTGFDTGPANTLINHWIQQQQNKSFDENGDWAASGNINADFLAHLLDDDFFRLAPPKSTGTEYFNASWLTQKLSSFPFLAAEDVQASLTAFTAKSAADAIAHYPVDEIILCGGGAHNSFLLQQFKKNLPRALISKASDYGIDPDYIEATAFAWLAKQTLENKTGNLPAVTGARKPVILGGVYYK